MTNARLTYKHPGGVIALKLREGLLVGLFLGALLPTVVAIAFFWLLH